MIDQWHNCYDLDWKGVIIDEAFSHPAKFSHALIRRIVNHLLEENLIQPGDTILDPFGGVGLGGLYCAKNGLQYLGVELEQKFVDLGNQNIQLWERRFKSWFPQWVTPILIQGDSRFLLDVIKEVGAVIKGVIGSPPYADSIDHAPGNKQWIGKKPGNIAQENYGTSLNQLANLPPGDIQGVIGSPPYVDSMEKSGGIDPSKSKHKWGPHSQMNNSDTRYGSHDGQLGAMPSGNINGVIGSPPFAGNSGGRGEASRQGIDAALFDRHSGGMKKGTGESKDNLDHLPIGKISGVLGSPPFENNLGSGNPENKTGMLKNDPKRKNDKSLATDYGTSPGQLGTESGQTFWQAAADIMAQIAMILPSGAPAVWITKRYIKAGKIVDFTAQWTQLCEAYGFRLIHHHKAMLVKDNGIYTNLFEDEIQNVIQNKSFFRLHYEIVQRSKVHWSTLDRKRQAVELNNARRKMWRLYYMDLANFENWKPKKVKPVNIVIQSEFFGNNVQINEDPKEKTPPKKPNRPTPKKIRYYAKIWTWKNDNKPHYDIETAIDWEDVLCFVRM